MKFLKKVFKIVVVLVIVILVMAFFNNKQQEKKRAERDKARAEESVDRERESSVKQEESSVEVEESSKADVSEESEVVEEPEQESSAEMESEPESSEEEVAPGIRPDVKEAIDAYEAFIDEYCEFVKLVSEDPTNAELMAGYLEYMVKLEEEEQKMKALDKDLTDEEEAYYLEVLNRCNQKLTETVIALE